MTRRHGPLWWILVPAVSLVVVSVGILVSRWGAVRASQPAYLVTLVAVALSGLVALAGSLWTLRPPSDRRHSPGWTVVRRALLSVGTVVLIVVLVLLRPLPATQAAVASMTSGNGVAVSVSVSSSLIRLDPEKARTQTGLVCYPGALVDPRAYVPLLGPIADAGFTVGIVKPPYGIALLSLRAPASVIAGDPSVRRWVVGGHSLGGVAAAPFAGSGNPRGAWTAVVGLVPQPEPGLPHDVAGDLDLGRQRRSDHARQDRGIPGEPPAGYPLRGGRGAVHAHFGDYGPQRGDGAPTIGAAEAQR